MNKRPKHPKTRRLDTAGLPDSVPRAKARKGLGVAVGRTEHHKAEAALRESEAKYRRLHDGLTDAIVSVDMAGRITDFNPAYQEMLGYTREELLQRTYEDLTPERWYPEEKRIVAEQILPHGHSVVYEKEYRRKDGTVFPVELRTFLIRDEKGKPIGMWAIVRDITRRKEVEEALRKAHDDLERRVKERTRQLQAANVALRESLESYQALIETTDTGYLILNDEGRVLEANAEYVRLTGHGSLREILGRSVVEWTAAHDRERNAQAVAECIRTGRVRNLQVDYIGPTRAIIPVEINGTMVETARGKRILSLCRDITERRLSEEALRASEAKFSTAFRHAPVLIVLADLGTGRFMNVNEEFIRVSGFSREEAIGKTSAELGWVRGEVRQRYLDVLDCAGRLQAAELPCRCKDGRDLVCLCNAEVIDVDGKKFLLSLAQDITERKRVEEALREARDMLEARVARRTVELETANAALRESEERLQSLSRRLVESQEQERHHIARELHDQIGQSLTAVEIHLQTALKSPDPKGHIHKRVEESLHMVDELVQRTQNLSLNLRPPLLDDLGLEPALRNLIERGIPGGNLRTEFTANPLSGRLTSDIETACFRVAQEAVTNAIRHAHARRLTVRLQVEDRVLHLAVSDDGRGFDPSSMRGEAGGFKDLGLLGMEERATLVGGRLEVRSTPGRGTAVLAWFPLKWRVEEPTRDAV
jgi:PAS domain S-box-containing protein